MQAGQKSMRVLAWVVAFEWILASAWMVANAISVRSDMARPTIIFPTYGQCLVVIVLTVLAIWLGYGFCRFTKWGMYGSLALGFLTNVPLACISGSFLRGPGWGFGILGAVLLMLFIVCALVTLRNRSLFQ